MMELSSPLDSKTVTYLSALSTGDMFDHPDYGLCHVIDPEIVGGYIACLREDTCEQVWVSENLEV